MAPKPSNKQDANNTNNTNLALSIASGKQGLNIDVTKSPIVPKKSKISVADELKILYTEDDETSYENEEEAENSSYSLLVAEARYINALEKWEKIENGEVESTRSVQRSAADRLWQAAGSLQQEYNLRTRELFDPIPLKQRLVQHYHQAIFSAHDERDYPRLWRLHREALFRFSDAKLDSSPDGIFTSKILSDLIFASDWDHASHLWNILWRRFGNEIPESIWSNINRISYFILHRRICRLERFYQVIRQERGWEESINTWQLLERLTRNALSRPVSEYGDAPVTSARDLIDILERLTDSASFRPWEYAIQRLLSANLRPLDKKAMWLYGKLRHKARAVPSKALLASLMVRLRDNYPRYAARLLQDNKRFYADDPEKAALTVINSLAFRGNLDAVLRLVNDHVRRFPQTINSRYIEELMRVYMRRADMIKVVTLFNSLRDKFNFEPTLACWHLLIMAHSRVNDIKGAISAFEKLRKSGVKLTPNTYEIMLSVHAKRGDIEPIQKLLSIIRIKNVEITMPMLDFVVLAYVKRDEILAAEKLCRQFLTSNVEGSRLRMWNFLLLDAALKWSFQRVNRVFLEMQVHNIGYDDRTLAALMHSLCNENRPEQAHKLVNKVMPRLCIEPTTLHWAILMKGYLKVNKVRNAFMIYRTLLKKRGTPDFSMKILLMKAASMSDVQNLRYRFKAPDSSSTDSSAEDTVILPTADAMLNTMEHELSPSDLAQTDTPLGIGPSQRIDEAAVSGAYQFLTYLYGVKGSSHKVDELYGKYEATSKRFYPDAPVSPSIRMLASLMVDYRKTKYVQGMEQSWALARKKAEALSRRYTRDRLPPKRGWVLPQYINILDLCLGQYILFLRDASREAEIHPLLRRLRAEGYWISSLNYNLFVQSLAVSSVPQLQIQAFRECEQVLMPGWQGWFSTTSVTMPAPEEIRFRVKQQQPRLETVNLRMKAPTYRTLVMMARLWIDMRARDQFERAMGGTFMMQLGKMAPRTVEAVQGMPKMNDRVQQRFLPDDA